MRTGQAPDIFYMEPDSAGVPDRRLSGAAGRRDRPGQPQRLGASRHGPTRATSTRCRPRPIPWRCSTTRDHARRSSAWPCRNQCAVHPGRSSRTWCTRPLAAGVTADRGRCRRTVRSPARSCSYEAAAAPSWARRTMPSCWMARLSYKDPRVLAALTWFKGLVDAGAYPQEPSRPSSWASRISTSTQTPRCGDLPGCQLVHRAVPSPRRTRAASRPAFPLGIMQAPAMDERRLPQLQDPVGGRQLRDV